MKTTKSHLTGLIASSMLLASCLTSCQKEDIGVQPTNTDGPAMDDSIQEATVAKNLKGLVILIDFSDAPASLTVDRSNKLINGVGYTEPTVPSSVRDYWFRQSRGKVNLTHTVAGYFRAPHPAKWYKDRKEWTDVLTLSKQALEWFKTKNPNYDWNSLSLSNTRGEEGTLLSVNFFITAGIPGEGGTHWLGDFTAPNGKETAQITVEQWDKNTTHFATIHEQGHSIWGAPDTYDHTPPYASGTGKYSVMSGNNNPGGEVESFGAPFLVQQGWVKVVDIQPNQSYRLLQDGATIARYVNPKDPKEYFLIEARKHSTLGNGMNPFKKGLLIWHVDENMENNDDQRMTPTIHYQYGIEQADGKFDLENGRNPGDAEDYFVPGKVFSNNSTPNSKWWNGSSSGLNINNIQLLNYNVISFCNGNCPN